MGARGQAGWPCCGAGLSGVEDNWQVGITFHKGRLDPIKLQEVIKEEFKDLSDRLFDILKKVFNNFKIPIDFDLYCGTI